MSRKRAAPGADPAGLPNYQQIQTNQWTGASSMDQNSGYPNSQEYAINPYQNTMSPLKREASNQLTRRDPVQMGLTQYGNNSWPVQQFQSQQSVDDVNDAGWQTNDDELDRKAESAERAALSNRKPIPPFVRKLRSFVDDDKNSDLIRWSDDGESFIVLDEDEFAKKLIPELFKHNKYPSFVRQLNMYGFHKKVALSDNSMRASERKSKSPSEYYNPFFKRGRPKLMWLIQKPKTGQSGKKGQNGEDLDDEDFETEPPGVTGTRARQSIALPSGQRVLSQEIAGQLHDELTAIRRNQAQIQQEVRKLREENETMQSRAAAYQAIHQRHENSINAILTFLATVFRNQIEGKDTASLASLFPQGPPYEQQQGDRVVDLADFDGRESSVQSSSARPVRRPLLLEAPETDAGNEDGKGRISSVSTPTAGEFPGRDGSTAPPASTPGTATEVKREESADVPQGDDILSFLNSQSSVPGGNINRLDYPQALSQLQSANSRSPISTPQRNDLLKLMANGQAGGASNSNVNNALISPSPPPIPGPSDPQWAARSKEIEALERSIREQDDRFNSVTQLLGPLSPSGSINFLDNDGNVPPPSDFDLNWLNSNSDGNGMGAMDSNDNPFFDFKDFDANNGLGPLPGQEEVNSSGLPQGRVMGTADNSEVASPAGTVNTIEDGAAERGEQPSPPSKRQRVS